MGKVITAAAVSLDGFVAARSRSCSTTRRSCKATA